MVFIGKHGAGDLPWTDPDFTDTPKTRLYCNAKWEVREEQYSSSSIGLNSTSPKSTRRMLTSIVLRDTVTGKYRHFVTHVDWDPELRGCAPTEEHGEATEAYTLPEINAVTICPRAWTEQKAVIDKSKQNTNLPPTSIFHFQAISTILFHEYTHIVGNSGM